MKPRVLILIDTYAIGGPGKVILQFLDHGGKTVCSPVVAGFWRGTVRPWQFRTAVEDRGVHFAVLQQRFGFDPTVIASAARLVRERRIELIESHGYKAHIVALALKLWLRLPWLAYVHGWTSENLKIELYNWIDRTIVRFADRVVPVSRALGQRLGPGAQAKMVCIPNATSPGSLTSTRDELRAQLGVLATDTLVTVIGRLSPEKGQRDFIHAFALAAATDPSLKAMLVGEGQDRGTLTDLIAQLELTGLIRLVGYQEDVSSYYQACDLVVIPSLQEGMPMVALEAMMHARPILATAVGGIPEVIIAGETGRLVPPADPVALAAALSELLKDRAELVSLGRAGYERALREFSPERRVASIKALYAGLLAAKTSHKGRRSAVK